MKALKRFYGESGRWYDIGDEVKEEKTFTDKLKGRGFLGEEVKGKGPDKVTSKVSTKRKRKPKENKNGKPKTEDK